MAAVNPAPSSSAPIPGLSIAPLSASALDQAWALRTRAIRTLCHQHYTPQEIEAWASAPMPRGLRTAVRSRSFLAAHLGSRLAGFGFLTREKDELEALFVEPELGRRGLARCLLGELEAEARKAGIAQIEVCASLNAVGFYLRAGYRVLKCVPFRHPAGFELDCVRMAHPLA